MTKLDHAKIYRIVSNITGENYYGSTTEPTLARRLAKHRCAYKRYLQGKYGYLTSFKILETNDYEIVLVEKLDNCNSKEELHQRERFYIENNNCVNKNVPNRTHKEYYVDNKDKILEKMEQYYDKKKDIIKQYYVDNKDNILEKNKQYYSNNKDKILEKMEQYYVDNKDKILERNNQYYHDNKDFLQEKNNCDCGGKFTTAHKSEHLKSEKHLNYISEQKNKIKLPYYSFETIFRCDSKMLIPRAYTNYIVY